MEEYLTKDFLVSLMKKSAIPAALVIGAFMPFYISHKADKPSKREKTAFISPGLLKEIILDVRYEMVFRVKYLNAAAKKMNLPLDKAEEYFNENLSEEVISLEDFKKFVVERNELEKKDGAQVKQPNSIFLKRS